MVSHDKNKASDSNLEAHDSLIHPFIKHGTRVEDMQNKYFLAKICWEHNYVTYIHFSWDLHDKSIHFVK